MVNSFKLCFIQTINLFDDFIFEFQRIHKHCFLAKLAFICLVWSRDSVLFWRKKKSWNEKTAFP